MDVIFDRGLAVASATLLGGVAWQLGGVRAETMAWALPALVVLAILVAIRWWSWRPSGAPIGWWWGLPMVFWASIQTMWLSPLPDRTWLDAVQWGWMAAGWMVAVHLMREPGARRILVWSVGVVTLVGVAAAGYQHWVDPAWLPMGRRLPEQYWGRSSGIFGGPNNFAMLLAMLLPVTTAWAFQLKRSRLARIGALFAVGLLGSGLLLTVSRGTWLAFAVALSAWPLTYPHWTLGRRLLGAVGVLVVAGVLLALAYWMVPMVRARIDIMRANSGEVTRPIMWRAAGQLWCESPWVGAGGGSFQVLLERHRPPRFWDAPRWVHNDYLNTLCEYGLVGLGASFGVVAVGVGGVWFRRRKRVSEVEDPAEDVFAKGLGIGLLALALATFIDFHLKIPALVLVAAGGGAEWLRRIAPRRQRSPESILGGRPRALVAVGFASVALAVVWDAPVRLLAEADRAHAREAINALAGQSGTPEYSAAVVVAIDQLERAVARDAGNRAAWGDLAMALALQEHAVGPVDRTRLGETAEAAARRALAISSVGHESWLRLGTALDLQGRWGEAGQAFAEAVHQAPNSQVAWYYQAFHWSRRPAGIPLARAALAICLRLDPWYPPANALRIELERSNR